MSIFNSFIDVLNSREIMCNPNRLKESKDSDIKDLKKSFDEFNKKFFNNEIPDIEIKITDKDTDHSKGVAGSFNHFKSVGTSIHSNKTGEHYNLSDLNAKRNKTDTEQRAYDYFVNNSYIELPKDIVKKGKYYFYSVLLHEMVHAWITLCTSNRESDPHGRAFRKKVDEINKKSNNEYRVAYEEVPQELVSDKPINERPEDVNESLASKEDNKKLFENIYLARQDGLKVKEIPDSVIPKFLKNNGKCSNIKYVSKKDYKSLEDPQNIEYKKGWVLKRNSEPEKFHNKFAKDEKNGIWYGMNPTDF